MTARVLTYLKSNVLAIVALTVALGTGGAYAANTIRSSDIVDGEILSADVKDQSLTTFDVSTFLGADVVDGTLTGDDVSDNSTLGPPEIREESLLFNNTLLASDLATGSVGTDEVSDNSLTGADINEASLAPTTTATFASASAVHLNSTMTKVGSKVLPAGSWAILATINTLAVPGTAAAGNADLACELRSGSGFIGGAVDRRRIDAGIPAKRSLSMNGGAQVPAGGEVSVWCSSQSYEDVSYGQMMMIRLDGFS